MKPGDVVFGVLEGAIETKVRPAVVIASTAYLTERPDGFGGILKARVPKPPASSDYAIHDWRETGLRAESYFRAWVLTVHRSDLTIIGHGSDRHWYNVKACVGNGFAK